MPTKYYTTPHPIIDKWEETSLRTLTERYNKLLEPGILEKTGAQIKNIIPEKVKELGSSVKSTLKEQELYSQCMKVVAEGFNVLEKQAAKNAISGATILEKVNQVTKENKITALSEVCLARSYNIANVASPYKSHDTRVAFAEGGVTGYFGFAGLPFNLVLSIFLYYRAVQSLAMFYGYDTKRDMAELVIASEVFLNALNPANHENDELGDMIHKVMITSKIPAAEQTLAGSVTKDEMSRLLKEMKSQAGTNAKRSMETAGKKGLENILFKEIFEQIGKRLLKKVLGKAIPVAGALISALLDAAQMKAVLEYADIFYQKRFIFEKEDRVQALIGLSEVTQGATGKQ